MLVPSCCLIWSQSIAAAVFTTKYCNGLMGFGYRFVACVWGQRWLVEGHLELRHHILLGGSPLHEDVAFVSRSCLYPAHGAHLVNHIFICQPFQNVCFKFACHLDANLSTIVCSLTCHGLPSTQPHYYLLRRVLFLRIIRDIENIVSKYNVCYYVAVASQPFLLF